MNPRCCWVSPHGASCRRPAGYRVLAAPRPGVTWYDTYTEACGEHLGELAGTEPGTLVGALDDPNAPAEAWPSR